MPEVVIKNKEVEVTDTDPFENDMLGMREHVCSLSNLLVKFKTPAVFAINGAWGTGKTTFVRMLKANLENEAKEIKEAKKTEDADQAIKAIAIYFNAWKTDYVEEPLVAFLGSVNKALVCANEDLVDKTEFLKLGGKVVLSLINEPVRSMTFGMLKPKELLEIFKKNELGEDKSITAFKKYLKQCTDGNKKLFIFIDELDRCKPTYAIKLLERIKHIFDVEGVVIILAMDKEQLSHSIKKVYGNDFCADKYLRRFIDVTFNIPQSKDLTKFIDHLSETYNLKSTFVERKQGEGKSINETLNFLARVKELSLRDVEQLFAKLNTTLLVTDKKHRLFPELLIFLLVAKVANPEAYKRCIENVEDTSVIDDVLYQLFGTVLPKRISLNESNMYECSKLERFFFDLAIDCDAESNYQKIVKYWDKHKENINTSPSSNEGLYSKMIVSFFNDDRIEQMRGGYFGTGTQFNLMKYLVSRIEMLEDFNFDS